MGFSLSLLLGELRRFLLRQPEDVVGEEDAEAVDEGPGQCSDLVVSYPRQPLEESGHSRQLTRHFASLSNEAGVGGLQPVAVSCGLVFSTIHVRMHHACGTTVDGIAYRPPD